MSDITPNELQTMVMQCLDEKLTAGFDSAAELTKEVAKAVTDEVMARHVDTTDEAIQYLEAHIVEAMTDTGELSAFMESVQTLLGDDDNSTIKALVNTTVSNSQLINEMTTNLLSVNAELELLTEVSGDHGARITVLEGIDRTPP